MASTADPGALLARQKLLERDVALDGLNAHIAGVFQEHLEFFNLVDVAQPANLQRRPAPMVV